MPQAMNLETPASGTHWSIYKFYLDKPIGLSANSYSIYVSADGTQLGHLYSGENVRSQFFATGLGTVSLRLRRNEVVDNDRIKRKYTNFQDSTPRDFEESGTFAPFDAVNLEFISGTLLKRIRAYLPEFKSGEATYFLDRTIFGTEQLIRCRTYGESSYTTLKNGLVGTRLYSDTISFTETKTKAGYKKLIDSFAISELIKYPHLNHPLEIVKITDSIEITSSRHATITDWQFKPSYKIYFDELSNDSYATTNWHGNVENFGAVSKSIKHWTGDFEVGNWNPQLNDPYNEIWGSLFNNSEGRMKSISLSAMIHDRPFKFAPQFTGLINKIETSEGIISFEIKDKLKDLPYRNFIYDYQNIGSSNYAKQWGIIKRVFGTLIMFDDLGDVQYIERKQQGKTILESIFSGVIAAIPSAITGNWPGAAIGFSLGVVSNLPTNDKMVGGYYQIQDFNVIPDDIVKSGIKAKFYAGSISGIATNLNHPLVGVTEHSFSGGTFINGLYGTFSIDDTSEINVGDYVYVRRPIILAGSPNEVVKALLTGSNIDYPYTFETRVYSPSPTPGGYGLFIDKESDFFSGWDNEWQMLSLINMNKIIEGDNTKPFDEIKEIMRDLQVSFYIDENNKFAIRTIRPRAIINPTGIATYTESQNILSGFKYTKSVEEAKAGVRFYYDYIGENVGALKNGYNRKLEVKYPNAIVGVNTWDEIESKWIHSDEDAKEIVWRMRTNTEKGIDKAVIPTTLYGIINTVTDIIRVTHRNGSLTNHLFEIESYQKNFDDSIVEFTAIDAQRNYGYGNCQWSGTSGQATNTSLSGYSFKGMIGSLSPIGSVSGTFHSFGSLVPILSSLQLTLYQNHLLGFGNSATGNTEVCYFKGYYLGIALLQRGMFNTIRRTYFPNTDIYDLGVASHDNDGNILADKIAGVTFRLGTTTGISSNLGTSFRFF